LIHRPLTTGIAVLPFENLSEEKEHAFFADGVQDDILIKLAKIADLKVISRTSVMQYRGKQDVRQIGNALRVSHVLEGTVRRSDGKVHVNAQLVDTRTDAGVWAEEYDRDLNEVCAIETELANAAINSAFRLKPDSAGAHLALARHLYHGYFDYDHARDELAIAARTLPNDARIFEWSGYIDRRQNRWHEAVRNFERAMELD